MQKYTKADMPFSKRLENFWFYNKNKVLIIGFFVLASIYSLITLLLQPKPDYTILLAAQTDSPSDVVEELKAELANYGEDINGDGKVTVDIYDCCTSLGADNSTPSVQFYSRMDIDDVVIYMLDDTKLESVRDYFKDEGDSAFLSVFDGKDTVSWKGSELDEKFGDVYGEINFLIRNPEKSDIESDDINKTVNASADFAKDVVNSRKREK